MKGILGINPATGKDDDTDAKLLLIELLRVKDKLWPDEIRTIDNLEKKLRRYTGYESRQILEIHGRVIK